ncbi:MAG: dihydrolipoamide acetyltransferase family protein [Bacteroidetes bacterium]|nr:dihydrolipoamide acetyltransferase family protein [Bacteroidota bacterium]
MANYEVVVPKLGESVIEATITKWLKNEGELIQEDEPIVEIATDKVDSEIPSLVAGKLIKKLFAEGDLVPVGTVFALIDTTDGNAAIADQKQVVEKQSEDSCRAEPTIAALSSNPLAAALPDIQPSHSSESFSGTRFYSPLVRSIALQENIAFSELDEIPGTGKDDRLTKQDVLNYLKDRQQGIKPIEHKVQSAVESAPVLAPQTIQQIVPGEDRMVEMDRIRQLIATHMVKSVQTSAHVTSFQEADMTRVVQWREKNKDAFQKRENEKLTFTPVFIDAIAKAVRDFPMVNVSVDGTKVIIHKNVNIGMAVSLPNFNLIVPVIRNAHEKSLLGLVKAVNDLAQRARISKLVPDEISGGTISLTNLGSFGTLMGTPIINQPQTAIVAVGAIKKRAVVIETPDGDTIAIRPIMMMSVTYDHRVIDGALGGQFLNRVVQYLETFDNNQPI